MGWGGHFSIGRGYFHMGWGRALWHWDGSTFILGGGRHSEGKFCIGNRESLPNKTCTHDLSLLSLTNPCLLPASGICFNKITKIYYMQPLKLNTMQLVTPGGNHCCLMTNDVQNPRLVHLFINIKHCI